MILCGLKELPHPCKKTLPKRLMQSQTCARGSRSTQALGKGCFSPRGPCPKEGKVADTSWQLSALQSVRTALCCRCPRSGDHRLFPCSALEKIPFVRKHS